MAAERSITTSRFSTQATIVAPQREKHASFYSGSKGETGPRQVPLEPWRREEAFVHPGKVEEQWRR